MFKNFFKKAGAVLAAVVGFILLIFDSWVSTEDHRVHSSGANSDGKTLFLSDDREWHGKELPPFMLEPAAQFVIKKIKVIEKDAERRIFTAQVILDGMTKEDAQQYVSAILGNCKEVLPNNHATAEFDGCTWSVCVNSSREYLTSHPKTFSIDVIWYPAEAAEKQTETVPKSV